MLNYLYDMDVTLYSFLEIEFFFFLQYLLREIFIRQKETDSFDFYEKTFLRGRQFILHK